MTALHDFGFFICLTRYDRFSGSSKVTATNGGSSDGASSSQDTGGATFDTMTPNERKSLLLHVCGVVSEHTKKICTRLKYITYAVEP